MLESFEDFFHIEKTFINILGYSLSYLEFFGVISGVGGVWLASIAHVWTWPVGIVNVILSFFLFYQIQLYPDMFLQVFFLITSLIGWWKWLNPEKYEADQRDQLKVSFLSSKDWMTWGIVTLVATGALGTFAKYLHVLFPLLFSKPSAFPYLDSFTTVASIIATFWMIRKKIECWYAWILIDVISTYMYYTKDVKFYSLLYLLFCFLAANGAFNWWKIHQKYSLD